jgi:hypothetical protein
MLAAALREGLGSPCFAVADSPLVAAISVTPRQPRQIGQSFLVDGIHRQHTIDPLLRARNVVLLERRKWESA